MNRRRFLLSTTCGILAAKPTPAGAKPAPLDGEVGITTGSFVRHLSPTAQTGKLWLLDLPHLMRNDLDMRVIDLMTATLPSLDQRYCEQLRSAAEAAGCQLTNLKMNQPDVDLGSADTAVRAEAVRVYRDTIDAAATLGVRWVRPLPMKARPDLSVYAESYQMLIDYAGERGIGVLVENFGWMQGDPDAIPNFIAAVGPELKAQPDTGNWTTNEIRYIGLEKAFPYAVSCDFKARELAPDGSHALYDLKRCFDIGWKAGFRGPWCLEHFHADLTQLYHEMGLLRDQLRRWMKAA
ncbi:MAG: TIM barrel protein [Verrucomicrobiales bacterium]|nr:TIM barrel protein [Verrucomicrobiales bacterium]